MMAKKGAFFTRDPWLLPRGWSIIQPPPPLDARMLFDMSRPILNYDHTPILGKDGKPMTLGSVCCDGLVSQSAGEELAGSDQVRNFSLAKRIFDAGGKDLSLSVDEIALIKQRVSKAFVVFVAAPAQILLEAGRTEPTSE